MEENDWQFLRFILLGLVSLFMVSLSLHEIFHKWGIYYKKTCYKFFNINSFALLLSSHFNLHACFRLFCQATIIQMLSLFQKEKVTCDNCGTQTTRNKIVRHKKSCSAGTLYCTQCPNFSTKSQNDLNYHIAEKYGAPKPDITFKCKLCFQEFPGFYALRLHRNTEHEMQIGSGTKDVNVEHLVRDVEDHSWRESCALVIISWWIRNLKWRDRNHSITHWKLSMMQSWTKTLLIFSTIKNVMIKWNTLFINYIKTETR